jgi:hypothetical protein
MKKFLTTCAILLLVFNGIGALYGGGLLMLHPDGSGLQMSTTILQHSPFHDFLIPGIVLFSVNGLCSFVVMAALLFGHPKAYLLLAAEGALLLGWIVVQVWMLQSLNGLHYTMGGTGLSMMILALLLARNQKKELRSSARLR